VISLLHHYLEVHSFGSTIVHFNADNGCGQNKNNTFLQYFMWRVLTDRSKKITYSFLPVGHTKFSPDWCFALLKRKFRRTEVNSLHDICCVVDESASVNISQQVGNTNGDILVPSYDWT
jgi:hypothetical protein